MYVPASFRVEELDALAAFMAQHDFATVITCHEEEGLTASHVPLLVSRVGTNLTLTGHLARANGHWRHFDGETSALAIFHGPHGYISPTWYKTHPAVPTWNYAVVQAAGKPHVLEESKREEAVRALVEVYEGGRSPRWEMRDTPPNFQARMLDALVAFEIQVETIHGKYKLSQNRSVADREGAIAGLQAEGGQAAVLAAFMRANSS